MSQFGILNCDRKGDHELDATVHHTNEHMMVEGWHKENRIIKAALNFKKVKAIPTE